MATAVASAMLSEVPSSPLPTNDAPASAAVRIAARPTEVYAITLLARTARIRALTAAPMSASDTMAWAARVAEPKTAGKKDVPAGTSTSCACREPRPWL